MWTYNQANYLCHFGVPGMKWGVRRYQEQNGGYTAAGKKRYNSDQKTDAKTSSSGKSNSSGTNDSEKAARQAKIKKAVKIGAVVAGTALAAYGAKKSSRLCAI